MTLSEEPVPVAFGKRSDPKIPHTDAEYAELMRELRRAAGGPILRFRKTGTLHSKYVYWNRMEPNGPNVSCATLRMFERRGYIRQIRTELRCEIAKTYVLTGKGFE